MKLIKWIVDVQGIRIIPLPKFCQRGVCVWGWGGGGGGGGRHLFCFV